MSPRYGEPLGVGGFEGCTKYHARAMTASGTKKPAQETRGWSESPCAVTRAFAGPSCAGVPPSTPCGAAQGVGSSAPARDVSRAEVCQDEREDVVGVGIAADHRLREHKPAVDMDVEYAVVAGDDLDCCEIVFVVLEQSRRQTGGVRSRASGDAVLDPDAV